MSKVLPFDAKNADDFEAGTRRLQEALKVIQSDRKQPATKANLARLAGVHRNTIYNRALASSPDDSALNGWPLTRLAEIKKARISSAEFHLESSPVKDSVEAQVAKLLSRLELSRRKIATWFHRALQLKAERDEALRQVSLLIAAAEKDRSEIDRLQKLVRSGLGLVRK